MIEEKITITCDRCGKKRKFTSKRPGSWSRFFYVQLCPNEGWRCILSPPGGYNNVEQCFCGDCAIIALAATEE